MCSRCGQRFPLVKLVVDVPEARGAAPCDECDREAFFGYAECGHCGRALRPIHVTN